MIINSYEKETYIKIINVLHKIIFHPNEKDMLISSLQDLISWVEAADRYNELLTEAIKEELK